MLRAYALYSIAAFYNQIQYTAKMPSLNNDAHHNQKTKSVNAPY